MYALRPVARLGRAISKPLAYALAVALPTVLAVAVLFTRVISLGALAGPPALDRPLPDRPAHDPARPTAVVVAGNTTTEVSDLLGPYAVLAASEAFNVYVVAPERRLTPLGPGQLQDCCAFMDLMPHYSFAEYDRMIGTAPDLIVVPYIPRTDGEDAAVLRWLRERPGDRTVILSICAGARVVADAGILAGHTATTQQSIVLTLVRLTHPEVDWIEGVRYVDDGRFISSAGVTSGIDATLYTVGRFLGRETALETARRIGYPHTAFLDDRTWVLPADGLTATIPNLFRFGRTKIGLYLYEGVDEIALSSVTDTYPRALNTDVLTIGAERDFVRTRHGLYLVPRHDFASAPAPERMLIPGRLDAALAVPAERWAEGRIGRAAERIHAGGAFAYDATIADLAHLETRLVARSVARALEYPTAHLALGGRDWQLELILRGLALSLLSPVLLLVIRRVLTRRRAITLRRDPAPA